MGALDIGQVFYNAFGAAGTDSYTAYKEDCMGVFIGIQALVNSSYEPEALANDYGGTGIEIR
jgi:imidazoleglycerol phosphate synthase glutamine amidotransferase subunit HisH